MELSLLAIIVWAELTFLLIGGLALLLINSAIQRGNSKKSINKLLGKLQSNRDTRLTEIRKGLKQYGLDGAVLEEKVKAVDVQERKLLERIVNMYRKRSDITLARLDLLVETATKPYFELDVSIEAAAEAATEGAASEVDTAELEQLREENKQLQEELSVTMDTIGRMLSEYSSMFDTEQEEANLDKGKIMEAFNVEEPGSDQGVEQGDELEVSESADATEAEALEDISPDEELEVVDDALESVETEELLEIDDELTAVPPEADQAEADQPKAGQSKANQPKAGQAVEAELGAEVVAEEQSEALAEEVLAASSTSNASSDLEAVALADEMADELTDEVADELDVVIDDVDPAELSKASASAAESAGVDDELDAIASELGEKLDEELLDAVTLDDKDVAELEAAGLDDIVDLETDPIDELVDLGDDLDFDVDLDTPASKAKDDKPGDTAAIDDLDIDSLIDANKKA